MKYVIWTPVASFMIGGTASKQFENNGNILEICMTLVDILKGV